MAIIRHYCVILFIVVIGLQCNNNYGNIAILIVNAASVASPIRLIFTIANKCEKQATCTCECECERFHDSNVFDIDFMNLNAIFGCNLCLQKLIRMLNFESF